MEPKIRFKGFEGEWLKRTACNIVGRFRTGKLDANAMVSNGKYRFYTCAKDYFHIDTYAFDDEALLISGNGENVGYIHYYNGKFNAYQRTYVLTDFSQNILFIKSYLEARLKNRINKEKSIGNTPYIRLDTIRDMEIAISPKMEEQQAIASYFTTLDSQISASTSRLASLKQMKAASLQAMFPQEGETVPKIRFKGFEGEWKKVKADSIFKTFNEKNRSDLPVLSATQDRGMVTRESIGYNIFHDTSNEATYKHILPGQFVIHLRSFQGGFAHSEIEGIASPAYTIMDFKNKELYYDYYWRYVFMSKEFIKRLELITYGIRDGRSISYDEFKEMSFLVPSKEEQIKIALYLRNLDHQITLQTQRLEKLKQIKSACLDKMFV